MLVTLICTGLFSKEDVTSSDLIIKKEFTSSSLDLYSLKVFNLTKVPEESFFDSTQSPNRLTYFSKVLFFKSDCLSLYQ